MEIDCDLQSSNPIGISVSDECSESHQGASIHVPTQDKTNSESTDVKFEMETVSLANEPSGNSNISEKSTVTEGEMNTVCCMITNDLNPSETSSPECVKEDKICMDNQTESGSLPETEIKPEHVRSADGFKASLFPVNIDGVKEKVLSKNEKYPEENSNDSHSPAGGSTVTTYDENSSSSAEFSLCCSEEADLFALPKEVFDEERKLALQNEVKMNKTLGNTMQLNQKEKERRYKSLMSLLGKSKEYASYMSKKLTQCKEETTKQEITNRVLQNATNVNVGSKRRGKSVGGRRAKKRKMTEAESCEVNYNAETEYENKLGLIVSRRQPETLIGGVMRDYQLDGLEWMVALYKNGVNGILADEMGLGKTIQLISLLCHLREKRIYGPHLIIAPLSTLPNWIFEFANFAPDIPVVLFHGSAEKRSKIKNDFISVVLSKEREKIPVVLTSFEMPLYDKNFLSAVKWCYTIVDEGHRLKNHQSLLARELRRYNTESRLLLTGTPLQNNLTELWSLLNYLIPEIFDNLAEFENIFDFSDLTDSKKQNQLIQKEKEEQIVSKMHQILEPFLLRRVKTDVNIFIPRKKEILVYAPLTAEQEKLYKGILDRSVLDEATPEENKELPVEGDGKRKKRCVQPVSYSEDWDIDELIDYQLVPKTLQISKTKMFGRVPGDEIDWVYNLKFANPSMMLRKIVNHPYLVKTPVHPGSRNIIINEALVQASGKLLVLDALLPKLKANDHKVLLFSTFMSLLDLVEDYMLLRKYKYVRLDGSCAIEDRLESIKMFNSDKDTFIFLISTRAGGLGINLTAADTVILYNSDWNPQADLQAQDRCHRIGQIRPVVIYRLVTSGTIDERIVNTATSKRRLEKLVVKNGKFKQQKRNEEMISIRELQELFQSTDFKQVIYPNGLVLSDQEINNLLDRSDLLSDAQDNAQESANRSMGAVKILTNDHGDGVTGNVPA